MTTPSKKKRDGKTNKSNYGNYEERVWKEIAGKKKGFNNIKKEIKKMWRKLDPQEKVDYKQDVHCNTTEYDEEKQAENLNYNNMDRGQSVQSPHCICRQRRSNVTMVPCTMCHELFHCDCINFCENLAKIKNTSYFCTKCINITFVPFLQYILKSTNKTELITIPTKISELYDEYSYNKPTTSHASRDVQFNSKNIQLKQNQISLPCNLRVPRGGIENRNSNCWLSSVLQCISSTPLLNLLKKWNSSSASYLLREIVLFLNILQDSANKGCSSVKLYDGPLAIARCIGMNPNRAEHKDASEFYNSFMNNIFDEISINEKQDLVSLFQWKILDLNRCLVSECEKMNGRSAVMWSFPVLIADTSLALRLQSLLLTQVNGRFTTEEDAPLVKWRSCKCLFAKTDD